MEDNYEYNYTDGTLSYEPEYDDFDSSIPCQGWRQSITILDEE